MRAPAYSPRVQAAIGLGVVGAYSLALAWTSTYTDYDVWGAVLIAPLLLLLTLPVARNVARTAADPALVRLVLVALVLKLAAGVIRFFVAFELYDGNADASMYVDWGKQYAEPFRNGIFAVDPGPGGTGTVFLRKVAGAVFALIGPTSLGAFLVFSWLSFLGLYLFYRAFCIGVPDGDRRRYALVLFFLPSLLFWPSSIGKEAWMLLTLGLSSYGAARVLARSRGGYVAAGIGLLATAAVRPHMAVLVCAALVLAYMLRPGRPGSAFGPATRLVGSIVMVVGLVVVIGVAEQRFGVENEGLSGAESVIDEAARRTNQGGSQFTAQRPSSPLQVPAAAFTVLFRPLPHEAHNGQAVLASLEGMLLLGLCVLSWRRLRRVPAEARRNPYIGFAMAYSLLFVLAFSSFGNFGILVRQRVQLLPLILVALALTHASVARPRWHALN